MNEIRVEALCKSYNGVPVLKNVSFTAEEGVTGIMAPSGAGKTTLLRLMMGLEAPDSGRIVLPESCRISAVFQEDRLLMNRTAAENLRFVAGATLSDAEIETLLGELGLENTHQPVREFSGGMRRRTALARALAVPFDVLILDEPFNGLDPETCQRCRTCILRRSEGKIVLLVSHDEGDLRALQGRMLTLEQL